MTGPAQFTVEVPPPADGSTRALDSTHLFKNKMLLGAIYRCQLGYELEKRLGVQLVDRVAVYSRGA